MKLTLFVIVVIAFAAIVTAQSSIPGPSSVPEEPHKREVGFDAIPISDGPTEEKVRVVRQFGGFGGRGGFGGGRGGFGGGRGGFGGGRGGFGGGRGGFGGGRGGFGGGRGGFFG